MNDHREWQRSKILVIDDEPANRLFLERLLDLGGYDNVVTVASGSEGLKSFATYKPDLVLLDLHMPELDGYEVLKRLRSTSQESVFLPILVFTADATHEARKTALEMGASDFLTKPGDATEILLRVKNFLMMRIWNQELVERNVDLECRVRERTQALEEAQAEIVERLALAGEHRDDDTGQHTVRVGRLSGLIARELGLAQDSVKLISLAARLHDLGKLGIPDAILLKPDRLTATEFDVVKTHCQTGAKILANSTTPLLQMAEKIAVAHHERYDGTGYPQGLSGDEIPVEARIVSVADVFDALTHERPYKHAWSVTDAVVEITEQKGRQFDPEVVDAFLTVVSQENGRLH